ncbi:MAG: hypothetical protein KGH60_00385 [Candidatus Micrarchaeota archaeon]|nr:hypothetical protein [Candidatus Micrarchaeota archaeon]
MKRSKFLKELEEARKRNHEDNLRFIDFYTAYLKSASNEEWSRKQKTLIDTIYAPILKRAKQMREGKKNIAYI